MGFWTFGYKLPRWFSAPLFGDRETFGLIPKAEDPCWKEWQEVQQKFYMETQRNTLGGKVNDSGYRILRDIPLDGLRVLEMGAGDVQHGKYWRGMPASYTVCDVSEEMMGISRQRLSELGVSVQEFLLPKRSGGRLPFANASFDLILTFYSLEHLYPFEEHLNEIFRVLAPGGKLVGGIPCEGGLGWGLGRYLTSRRWLRRNTAINPDKIICWEHPNFADQILGQIEDRFHRRRLRFWPLQVPSIDLNLVASFVYEKR